jgi:hypothetical protein
MIYGDFLSIPLILVITMQNRKTLLCVFLYFKIPGSNWPVIFLALIFYHKKHLEKKKSMRWGPGAKRAQVAWTPGQAMPPMLKWASSLQRHQSSSPDAQLDLKTSIYRPPSTIPRWGGGDTQNREIEAIPAQIGGGNDVGVAPGRFSTLSDVNTIITAMKRE